ncbi:hypothetical protein M0813_14076 [Anaeramoeba flamelloides]|uniref:DDE-1 domain-containing protein n=1 Tax=Anaeramoeba flamelloides TaxID=1746091 RepID=A0ABQ8Z755_9EUKA|nr:hypothetical protein M0813_14076 [Anaeramoeba flamelloides]
MTENFVEKEIELVPEDQRSNRQNFETFSFDSDTEEEEDEDLIATENNPQIELSTVHQEDQNLVGEEALDFQDDQSQLVEEVSLNDRRSEFLTEEKVQDLIQSRLLAKFESLTLATQKQINEKEKVVFPFHQFPKLLLIPNEIEMFASAICVCERKRITPFNLSFVREVFNIGRGKIYRAKKSIKSGREVGKNGRPCLLNKAEEQFVVERLKILSMIGWAPTLDETVEIANELIASWLQVDFRVQRPLITSNIWVHEFAKRNNMRITRSSPIEYQRIIVNEEMITHFFQTLKELYEEKQYTSHLIFNMDETSLKLTQKQVYVVLTSQTKKKAYRAQEKNGKLMSAVVTISARGKLLKTLLLLPTKTFPTKVFEENELHNFGMVHSPKALLILDGHSSRADLRAIHLLQQHFIDCVVIPGHSSHLIQPLDVGIFRHFKTELKKQQRHKNKDKNFFLVLDHCLNLATSTMRIVEAFNNAGIYPLNLEKKIKGKSVFPTEVKEFAFSNYNRGSRLRISGQILTSENFIKQLTNKEKRVKKARELASKKHIPPNKLFKKLFSGMKHPFQHLPLNINEIDQIYHVSQTSSIENINNRLLTIEKIHSNIETNFLETNTNEIGGNHFLLNGNPDFENLQLTNNSNRQTIQPIIIRQEINQTNLHAAYDNRPLIEPTIHSTRNNVNNPDNDEIYIPLSPGRTSIHTEKNFLRSNRKPNTLPNTPPNHSINQTRSMNSHFSTPTNSPNQNRNTNSKFSTLTNSTTHNRSNNSNFSTLTNSPNQNRSMNSNFTTLNHSPNQNRNTNSNFSTLINSPNQARSNNSNFTTLTNSPNQARLTNTHFSTPTNSPNQNRNTNFNFSTPRIRNNNQSENRPINEENQNYGQLRNSYKVVKNLLYQRNTVTPPPIERILYPSNRLSDHRGLIEFHQNNNLNNDENVMTDYYQPRDPELRNLLFVQEQRLTKLRSNKEKGNTNFRSDRGGGRGGRRGRGRRRGRRPGRGRGSRQRRRKGDGGNENQINGPRRHNNSRRDSNYRDTNPNSFFQRNTPKENRLRRISDRTHNNLRQFVNNDNEYDN